MFSSNSSTTPFARNQSVICTDSKLALKAWKITNEFLFRNPMEVTKHCPKSCTQVQVAWLRLERLQSYAEKSLRKVLNTDRILMIEMGGFDPCRHCPDMINKQYNLIRIIFRKH